MKWYMNRLEELKKVTPIYSVCGDDCAVCPRYLAHTEEELRETAEFWYRVGWRDHVVTNEEIACTGCGCRQTCSFMILPCLKEHNLASCGGCGANPCEKIASMLERSDRKEMECRDTCASEEEFLMLKRAFYEKRENLSKQ